MSKRARKSFVFQFVVSPTSEHFEDRLFAGDGLKNEEILKIYIV
jgi:hypothetical protein